MSLALNTVVFNEEHRIRGLLSHASKFCDELVVVVDEESSDGTFELARGFGATMIVGPHAWYAEPLRPLAAKHTKADWIIVLDADEVLSRHAIVGVQDLDREQYKSVNLPRTNFIDGVRLGGDSNPDAQLRMFEKGAVRYGLAPHSRIKALEPSRTFDPQTPGWIIHSKTTAEMQVDHDRERAHGGVTVS